MADVPLTSAARRAGALYLAMMPFGFFGIVYVPTTLIVPGDAAATAGRILASEWLFRAGILSHLITQVIFIFLVLALYRLLEPVSVGRARLMVILALLGVPMAMLNEVHQLAVLTWLDAPTSGAYTTAQLQAQAMASLDVHAKGILISQIFWGLWLLPLGALVFQSGFVPRALGILLVIAGVGYVLDSTTQLMAPGFPLVSQFTFVGELALSLWLLIRGVRIPHPRAVAVS